MTAAARVETPRDDATFRSQNGEDRWLDAHFGGRRSGFFVEVGAYDGVNLSNTYHFEQIGWRGILVEPDPDNAAQCRARRPGSRTFECAVVAPDAVGEIAFYKVAGGEVFSTTSFTDAHRRRLEEGGLAWREVRVRARTLDSILEEAGAGAVDFVTIDVEGGELQVLRGFDIGRWRPGVVVVETNTRRRDPAIRDYFTRQGYAYRHSIDVNDFYLRLDRGKAWASALDAVNYFLGRVRRRLARTASLARRAWRKRVARRGDS